MKARIKWIEGAAWLAESDSGHGTIIDGSPDIGGRNLGPRPMELVLQALGGCTAMDVIEILRKQRQDVTDCVIEVRGERADTIPRVFTHLHVQYTVTGRALKPAAVERAVQLSAEKYCSVSRMLAGSVQITHGWTAVEAGAAAD